MLATNEYFSVGGGFVVNKETQTAENLYYRETNADEAETSRREKQGSHSDLPAISDGKKEEKRPPYLFASAEELYALCEKHNLTIAQVVWENELAFRSVEQIERGLMHREFVRRVADSSVGDNGRVYPLRSDEHGQASSWWSQCSQESARTLSATPAGFLPRHGGAETRGCRWCA